VEAHGALARLHREGAFTEKSFRQTRARLSVLSRAWSEVLPVELVREQAEDHWRDTEFVPPTRINLPQPSFGARGALNTEHSCALTSALAKPVL